MSVAGPDIFGKCLALQAGESLLLTEEDERTFFNWRFASGDKARTAAEIFGFLSHAELRLERDEQQRRWRIYKRAQRRHEPR